MIIEEPLQTAIDELSKLPSIGKKTAQRLALHLLKCDRSEIDSLARAIVDLKTKLRFCSICFNISSGEICSICSNHKRDSSLLCVVEEAQDVIAIERTNEFKGVYHVLGGVLSPLEGKGPEALRLTELINRLSDGAVKEIILALNPDAEGEATSLFIAKRAFQFKVKATRLARGLPVGGDLEFADDATIGKALNNRIDLT